MFDLNTLSDMSLKSSFICFSFILSLSAATSLYGQDRSEWFEFYLPWTDSTRNLTDMSGYLDKPAGKYGFLEVTPDGHFKFENKEQNERFVGVVNVAIANFPTREEARIIVARMAKFGINLVRIHLVDVDGSYGLFQNSSNNTLQISADRLDKMDYFIYCMKEKGIYFNFCIHSGRIYKPADGIASPVENDQSKYITLFAPEIIELQKDFTLKTIGHLNPYTQLKYADDPAMATVELTNENSLFNGWFGWQPDFLFAETTGGIGQYYSDQLDSLFNSWLKTQYPDNQSLEEAWQEENSIDPDELILNGSFEQNLTGWQPLVTGGSTATINTDESIAKHGSKSAKISITGAGTENWHVQLKSNNFKVEKGKDYKVTFYSRADVEKDVILEIMENDTWKWMMGPVYKTATDWKLNEIFFNAQFDSDKLILAFGWGKQTGTFWLDSVSVTETAGIGLEPGESLADGNISRTKESAIGKYTRQRIGDNAAFYFDTEKKYTEELTGYLKNDLGVKCPVTFTNNNFGLASVYSQSQADYIDFHMYWDHPSFPNGWSEINFTLKNKSILLYPETSTFNRMQLTKVKDLPHVLSEYNHPYPYIFQVEAPSLLYAYGSFFDLDGIMWHAYYDYMNRFSQRYQDMFFDIAMHPVMMTQMLLALPYRLKYIKPAQTIVEAHYSENDVFNNTKIYQDNKVINMENKDFGTSLLHSGFQNGGFTDDSTYLRGTLTSPGKIVTSETGELYWNGIQGYFSVNNPYWQGATGYLGGKNIELENIIISDVSTTNDLNFASIHLISLDSLPIGQSKKMILLTGARLENQGLKWNDDRTSLEAKGGVRALCEPVQAKLKIRNSSTDSVSVYALNTIGERSESITTEQSGTDAIFTLNKKTLWYEIGNHKIKPVSSDNNLLKANKKLQMKSLPNPSREYSTIEYSFPENAEAFFFMYNSLGQLIFREPVHIESKQIQNKKIDTSLLAKGIYIYGFQFKSGEFITGKLVVNNQ